MALRLMRHAAAWQQEYEQSKSMLLYSTDGLLSGVEHVGSTAVADLVARPVIDMLAGIRDVAELNQAAMLIEGLNYRRAETPEWCDDELVALLCKPRHGEVTHEVLLVREGGAAWEHVLWFRDRLRSDAELKRAYEQLKLDNFEPTCSAEANYAAAKAEFISQRSD